MRLIVPLKLLFHVINRMRWNKKNIVLEKHSQGQLCTNFFYRGVESRYGGFYAYFSYTQCIKKEIKDLNVC